MPNGLQSNPKLFVDDTSLFATVKDITTSTVSLNNDLTKISERAVQWKMNFNPDPSKQAQELLFSRKISSKPYPSLYFNDNPVHQVQLQQHLGLFLDQKLSFDEHIQCILMKTHKIIGMIKKLQPIIPRAALLTIYKSFLRPHLDYGDVIYDRIFLRIAFNESFQNKLESVQYDAALAITGAIRGSSREKLYQELGLESLKSRRWYRKLCLFFKLKKNKHPSYHPSYQHGLPETITTSLYLMLNMNISETLFFHPLLLSGISSIITFEIRNRLVLSKNKSLNSSDQVLIVRLMCIIPMELNYLTRLRVGLSHLREHKFRHNFQDSLDPFCNCGRHIETTIHFFLHCSNYSNQRKFLFEKIINMKRSLLNQNDLTIVETLLFGSNGLNNEENAWIIESTIEYIISTEKFITP